ncbi:MAG: Bug family tripartite tricarboxylate transporter substrate binding protein [Hydrogenophaga sp.]|jgi:tripartite-type tricarboxylate transporter receptor subunit TctC|uniref:Bug family tripartite tricarboxylate transporter substrate binding protein n=1 Tax=Hydrogenophaga sp. TaxID=1904254 RepID=UPI0025BDDBF9|nr:Bug family tripartite tricarboxylate transporter substrate binding protein [Hydrogenophaga sp.]MDP3699859.1 Bug family tripartite tricarboxylate transporter substrate binding protein [Hylemonella sp.]MDO9135385.1 Bug family tripartite tricarboxylate transporter substrate binding protein [Hydrogenophaga sp.]MDO9506935.1 Bug family tripartite tricarboxylate transporter substrate binding protein [Hydrogenophaga sp.]MDP1780287.1 Bug family tripartite tricarboxylate transporter substrate binding 
MSTRRHFIQATAATTLLGSLGLQSAHAQNLEQVKIVNGFPAGGSADVTSRRIGEKLGGSAYTKNAAVVENKTGAAGRIAVETVKNAAPDGATLLLTPYSMMAIYPHIYKQLSYDPFKDLTPVCMASLLTHGLAVGPMVPASVKTVKDYLAWAKANPKDANYGSPAAGSTPHFLGALLGLESGVDLKHVPYRGSIPGITDVIGGQLASMVTPHGDFLPNHRAGKLRIIATSGKTRSPFVPEVPTFAEQGFSDLVVEEWFGFYAPAKTPAAVVASANTAINAALKEKTVIDSLALSGMVPMGGSADDMAKSMQHYFEFWGPIVKKIGFTAES